MTDVKNKRFVDSILSENNRPALLVVLAIVVIITLASFVVYYLSSEQGTGSVNVGSAPARTNTDPNAEQSEAYKEKKREQNSEYYEQQSKQVGGVALPFTFNEERPESIDDNIAQCGCTFSDEQLANALRRLGLNVDMPNNTLLRIGNSDIYLDPSKQLFGDDDKPLLYAGNPIFTDSEGALHDENGITITLSNGSNLFLSDDGRILNSSSAEHVLNGKLLMSTGTIILSNGQKSTRNGNMKRVNPSDIYVTLDGQLATMDGKPVLHSGNFVFIGNDSALVDGYGNPVVWQSANVFISESGKLVDNAGDKFKTPGILFSWGGILIDNDGKLTAPLQSLAQVGESDIYLNEANELRDSYGESISYYGDVVVLQGGGQLQTADGTRLVNRKGANVTLDNMGYLKTPIQQGSPQSGILKDSTGVAYDKHGQLLSRVGKLEQKGASDVHTAIDGLLADGSGKALAFRQEDMFLDFQEVVSNGLIGLITYKGTVVVDFSGNRVYLNNEGEFVDLNNKLAVVGADITDSTGVVVDATGSKIDVGDDKELLLGPDGKAVFYNGKPVYKGEDGRLYDAEGNPVLGENGEALFLNEDGVITDENGQPVTDLPFTDAGGNEVSMYTDVKTEVLGPLGEPMIVNGKKVFKDDQGNLVFEDGTPVLDANGNPLSINADGVIMDVNGISIDPDSLQDVTTSLGDRITLTNGKKVTEVLGENGEPLLINGKRVFRDDKGNLVYEDGTIATDASGSPLKLRADGKVVNSKGKVLSKADLVAAPVSAKLGKNKTLANGLKVKEVLGEDGKPLMVNGKKVFRDAKGNLVFEDGSIAKDASGSPLKLRADGKIVNSNGKVMTVGDIGAGSTTPKVTLGNDVTLKNGKKAQEVLGKDGKPLMVNGKKVFKDENGNLVFEDGTIATDASGKALTVNPDGSITNSDGVIINPETMVSLGKEVTLDNGVKANELLGKDGKPLMVNGKKVFKDENGNLVFADGSPATDENGKKLSINPDGSISNSDGVVLDPTTMKPMSKQMVLGQTYGKLGKFSSKGGAKDVLVKGNVAVTKDGFLLDKNGKALKLNGKNIRVDKNGRVLDENGNPVLDANGNAVFLNENGEFVTESGELAKGLGITNGDGELIDATGQSVKDNMGRIGDSDVFVNPEGFLLDENGKPLTYDGKPVRVDEDGRLIDEFGNPILDENGNAVYLNNDGSFTDKNGNPSTISLENGEGQLVSASGKTALTNASDVNGTNLKVSEDNFLLDSNGKSITVNGKNVKLEGSQLVDSRGRAIRYNNRAVYINENGELVDSNGDVLTNENGEALKVGDLDVTSSQPSQVARRPVPVEQNIVEQNSAEPEFQPELNNNEVSVEEPEEVAEQREVIDLESFTQKDIRAVNSRYAAIKASMVKAYEGIEYTPEIKSSHIIIATSNESDSEVAGNSSGTNDQGANGSVNGTPKNEQDRSSATAKAGESLFAITDMAINTDHVDKISVKLVGLHRDHKLYRGVAYGSVELRRDAAVLLFNRVCSDALNGCVGMNGIALDPGTLSAGLQVEIDEHFWYRYGGLFLASFVQGGAEAVAQSVDRTEEITPTGSRTILSGVDEEKLAWTAAGTVGETFVPLLQDRINRPVTVKIPKDYEMVIKLFDDIK